jgi:hypothetical protein
MCFVSQTRWTLIFVSFLSICVLFHDQEGCPTVHEMACYAQIMTILGHTHAVKEVWAGATRVSRS